LQQDHNVQINEQIDQVHQELHQVVVAHLLLTEINLHNVLVVQAHVLVLAAHQDLVVHDQAPAVHLEKVAERKKIIRARKRFVKKSTIWKHQQLVAQLFQEVMETLQLSYAAAHPLQTLQRR
jgi:hypothetical protein